MSAERINQLLVLLPDSELPDDVGRWLALVWKDGSAGNPWRMHSGCMTRIQIIAAWICTNAIILSGRVFGYVLETLRAHRRRFFWK